MLTDIKYIRVWEQQIEIGKTTGKFRNQFNFLPRITLSSYISAIFHASLYEAGDFELVVDYDEDIYNYVMKPVIGYYEGEYFVSHNVFVELCGQSTGTGEEQRLFKVTGVSLINDENNNLTVKITGVGALGVYANMGLCRYKNSSVVQYDSYENIVPKYLLITGQNTALKSTELEHLFRMFILPMGTENSPRETLIGTNLYCPDIGVWVIKDSTNGDGVALTEDEEKISLQTDFQKWATDYMKSHGVGIVGFRTEYFTSETAYGGVLAHYEDGALLNRYTGRLVLRRNGTKDVVFSDKMGTFTLTSITISNTNVHNQAPLMYGQENEINPTDPKTVKGVYLANTDIVDQTADAGFSYGGNMVLDGTDTFCQYDVNKPVIVKSSYKQEDASTDDGKTTICKVLRNESNLQAVNYTDTITIEGTINVNDKTDVGLGDIVTIRVLDAFEEQVTITDITYVSEGDGFKVEVGYA